MSTPVDKTLRLDRTQLGQKRPSGRPPTFLIAIVAGVVAAIVVALVMMPFFKSHASDNNTVATAVAPPAPTTVPVLVAATAIDPRTPIKDSMVKVVQEQPDKAPQANSLSNPLDAVGKVSIGFIQAGAPVTSDLLNGKGLSNGLAFGIDTGMRAVTIALDPVSSVAGFLKPRDHVDVIGTFDEGNGQSVTRTVLQNVLLLATGSQLLPNQSASTVNTGNSSATTSDASAAPASTVAAPIEIPNATVQVTSVDAQKLIVAASKGKLQLALRPYTDNSIEPIPVTHSSAVTGVLPLTAAGPAPVQHPAPPIPLPTSTGAIMPAPMLPSITVIKGTDSKTVTVGQ